MLVNVRKTCPDTTISPTINKHCCSFNWKNTQWKASAHKKLKKCGKVYCPSSVRAIHLQRSFYCRCCCSWHEHELIAVRAASFHRSKFFPTAVVEQVSMPCAVHILCFVGPIDFMFLQAAETQKQKIEKLYIRVRHCQHHRHRRRRHHASRAVKTSSGNYDIHYTAASHMLYCLVSISIRHMVQLLNRTSRCGCSQWSRTTNQRIWLVVVWWHLLQKNNVTCVHKKISI